MKQIKVLYVDDDIVSRKLFETILKKSPYVYETLEAKDGKEALEILNKNGDIDLILLDIIMPRMDGIEMLEFMKKDPRFDNIPVIVLSTDDSQKIKALEIGANDFLSKPIKEEELNAKIAKYLSL
ncbi:MAG: response regulator [Epsilonproteobacteria bacterium]|nr:response regulator [Campylobacterota bacterium]